jgi:hypothetical protein
MERGGLGVGHADHDEPVGRPLPAESADPGDEETEDGDDGGLGERLFTHLLEQRQGSLPAPDE